MTSEMTYQRMRSEPWEVHILRDSASVEHREDAHQFADMLRSYSSRTLTVVEFP